MPEQEVEVEIPVFYACDSAPAIAIKFPGHKPIQFKSGIWHPENHKSPEEATVFLDDLIEEKQNISCLIRKVDPAAAAIVARKHLDRVSLEVQGRTLGGITGQDITDAKRSATAGDEEVKNALRAGTPKTIAPPGEGEKGTETPAKDAAASNAAGAKQAGSTPSAATKTGLKL